jgi:hypothetical protein
MNKAIKVFWKIILIMNVFMISGVYPTFLCRDPNQFLQFVSDYQAKIHQVTTSDGYHLGMIQIFPNSTQIVKNRILENKVDSDPEKKGTLQK